MVKCDLLLLAASIFLIGSIAPTTPVPNTHTQNEQPASSHSGSDIESSVPIHRVILLLEPVKDLSDPLVINLHKRALAQKEERKRKRSLPRLKLPGDAGSAPTFALPGKAPHKQVADPTDSINIDQLTALAELYFTESVVDRLTSRYRITVADSKEVEAATKELHLSRDLATGTGGAQRLCSRLDCDAVVVIGPPALTLHEGMTRDLVMRLGVRLAALRDPHGGFTPIHRPKTSTATGTGATHLRSQVDYTVAGVALANRAFLSAGYSANYAELAEQAAVQAAALAMHALSTGEQAPLMNADARVAIAPVYGPDRADMLVLANSGRHTQVGAVKPLAMDVSALFRPDLLPVTRSGVIDSTAASATMRVVRIQPPELWRDNNDPDTAVVRRLGNRLRVQFVLLAHVTDVEVSMAPPDATNSAGQLSQPADARSWEREAHAEAVGALMRTQDGAVIWKDRGDTIVTSREKVSPATAAAANKTIATDAEKFALIDLNRRFAAFRSQFEQ